MVRLYCEKNLGGRRRWCATFVHLERPMEQAVCGNECSAWWACAFFVIGFLFDLLRWSQLFFHIFLPLGSGGDSFGRGRSFEQAGSARWDAAASRSMSCAT